MKKPKKSLSQNFLKDKNICQKIVNLTEISNKIVVEIGPGYGFMTDIILEKNPLKLILIEKDNYLVNYLNEKYRKYQNIEIIKKDILNYDFKHYGNLVIISNLPYNVSTKIILYLFNFNQNILEMIFMVQKEVASKFDYRLPKMNKYKFLTKIVSSFNICFDVSPKVFFPKPKVYSTVVRFKIKKNKFDLSKAHNFSKLIFRNIRKKICNNINLKNLDRLSNKRVDQLTIKELLKIYNFF
tara:strand:- start:313 stop:1032 length:720 start_codon:yes stop_codon:yes gene_type:complete